MDLFSDENRRNPYPIYERMRRESPVAHVPPPFDAWLVFDYETVRRTLKEHDLFSSGVPGPPNWFIFSDPPRHTRLRGLIARAFTPRVIADCESRIRAISGQLLDAMMDRGEVDLATEYSVPLPMKVIAGLIGIPEEDWPLFKRWSDSILKLSYARNGELDGHAVVGEFRAVTGEMSAYLAQMIARRSQCNEGLLIRLAEAEVDGERLSHEEILGFFQLLVVGGQETTANLINNAMLCFLEHPEALRQIRGDHRLLPSAIEEVLRYRSPLQWLMRTPTRDVELHGQLIPKGKLVLAMIGSANRDPQVFDDPNQFDIRRQNNPHLAFGQGVHFCAGAPLARMEARIALGDILTRFADFKLASDQPWQPRQALHVHGPTQLPIAFSRPAYVL